MKALAVAGLLGVVIALITGCSCFKDASDVRVSVRKITISDLSFGESTVDVAVRIENKNPVGAVLEKVEYDIYIGHKDKWIWLGRGGEEGLNLGVDDTADFIITTKIDNGQLLKSAVDQIFGTEPSQMKVDGDAWFTVGPASIKVHFDEKDIDPFSPIPTVEPDNAEGSEEEGA